MAKGSGANRSGLLLGILAIVAGVLVIWGAVSLKWIVGIFLIIYGIVALVNKS